MQQLIDGPPSTRPPLINPILPDDLTTAAKKIAHLSQTHYGWCPYDDIELMGPMGLERRVAYDAKGNFVTRLLRSQLHVYTNVEIKQLSEKDNNIPNGPKPLMEDVEKYAGTCCSEIEDAYGEWGYMRLAPLTGMPLSDTFAIFSVIQPFAFDLVELADELTHEAPKRIAAAAERDRTFNVAAAEETQELMIIGANRAIVLANRNINDLRKDMVAFVATKQGRSYPSPGDEHLFRQLRQPLPTRAESKANDDDTLKAILLKLIERDNAQAQDPVLTAALETIRRQDERQQAIEQELRELREKLTTKDAKAKGSDKGAH
jgi:hypothetical protein